MFVRLPITLLDKEPSLVSIDHADAYLALEPPPEPRQEEEILRKEVYERIVKDRQQRKKKRAKKQKKKTKSSNRDGFTLSTKLPQFMEKAILYARVEIKSLNLYVRTPKTSIGSTGVASSVLLQLKDFWFYSTDPNWNVCSLFSFSFPLPFLSFLFHSLAG